MKREEEHEKQAKVKNRNERKIQTKARDEKRWTKSKRNWKTMAYIKFKVALKKRKFKVV